MRFLLVRRLMLPLLADVLRYFSGFMSVYSVNETKVINA